MVESDLHDDHILHRKRNFLWLIRVGDPRFRRPYPREKLLLVTHSLEFSIHQILLLQFINSSV